MINQLIQQIKHLGYKISKDPYNNNVWKIIVPGHEEFYSLDYFNNNIMLYKDLEKICHINEGENSFEILLHLPDIVKGDVGKNSIEDLFSYCDVKDEESKKAIVNIFNYHNSNRKNNEDKRKIAQQISFSLSDLGYPLLKDDVGLSLIDVVLKIL
tara:strand:- start:622 stop:1086 length:465 start_codon:yes stop_codon:yes gene_type:complete